LQNCYSPYVTCKQKTTALKSENINILELSKDTTSIEEFNLRWRFTEEKYNLLSPEDLSKIHPLNEDGTKVLDSTIDSLDIRKGYELNKDYFTSIVELNMRNQTGVEIKNWLDQIQIEPEKNIFLLWDSFGAAITKWHIFKKYYDDFFYPVSDDLTIVDESFDWTLYLFHEEVIYYGLNR